MPEYSFYMAGPTTAGERVSRGYSRVALRDVLREDHAAVERTQVAQMSGAVDRAWLSDRPVVVLDEPTEHLGDEQGRRILQRLLHRLRDRIVVLSSHRFGSLLEATTIGL